MVDTSFVLPRTPAARQRDYAIDGEYTAAAAVLVVVLALGVATAGHYVLSVDEFNTDDYGPKAVAWYTSGFVDRSHFDTVEAPLWLYGPWFQMLVAFVQSLGLGDPVAIRHALTFTTGLAGLAALVPMGRIAIGRWAGLVALALCLLTGYVYGNLFFATIDVPFLFAMSWATLAIMKMASTAAPRWSATVMAGVFTGIAMATRTGGVITHAYLVGALGLAGLDLFLRIGPAARPLLWRTGIHAAVVIAVAWMIAIALWPWLQLANPLTQFAAAYTHFATIASSFAFLNWGVTTFTNDVPWWYIPGQMLVRLPEGFLALLVAAIGLGLITSWRWSVATAAGLRLHGVNGLRRPLRMLAGARAMILVTVAAFGPLLILIVQGSTLYDGIRHVLFTIPMLALVAAWAGTRLLPLLRRVPVIAGAVTAAHVGILAMTLVILHPLEYVAMNAAAGGLPGAQGRFELDYWNMSVGEGVRRLERLVDADGRFAGDPPRVILCIGWREPMTGVLFRRPWRLETDPDKADFLIATERTPCAEHTGAVLIDTIERFGVPLGWIYANHRGKQD